MRTLANRQAPDVGFDAFAATALGSWRLRSCQIHNPYYPALSKC